MFHMEQCIDHKDMNIPRRRFLQIPLSLTAAALCRACSPRDTPSDSPKERAEQDASPLAELHKTSPYVPDPRRREILAQIQRRADACENTEFEAYCANAQSSNTPPASAPQIMRDFEYAFETIAGKLANKPQPKSGARLYLLYNMGYIVQTPTTTFGIDIVHTQTERIAELLDFLLITHRHADHYSPALVRHMGSKPVVSNFIENEFKQNSDTKNYKFGGIDIAATLTHHGSRLPKFNSTFEIACLDTAEKIRILHVGDAGKYEQIKPSRSPDVFIPHVSVGLDIKKCAEETIKPRLLLMSHLLELGHPTYKWRHPLSLGLAKCDSIKGTAAIMPFWGECVEVG